MGVDFLKRAAPTFQKSWNNGRTDLATPDLFTREHGARTRSVTAQCHPNSTVTPGTAVTLIKEGAALIVLEGSRTIGTIDRTPGDEIARIAAAGGVALGKVCSYYPISGSFDVDIQ